MLGEVLTAIVTPFRENGSVDLDGFRALCDHLLDNGSDGIVVTGTTGEAPTLSDDERMTLYAAAVETAGGAGPSSRARARTRPPTPCTSPSRRTRSASTGSSS